jgi:hypothetical protein
LQKLCEVAPIDTAIRAYLPSLGHKQCAAFLTITLVLIPCAMTGRISVMPIW